MKLGVWGTQPDETLKIIDSKLTEVTSELEPYYAVCAEMDDIFRRGELDTFVYDEQRTGYDQAYQGHLNKRNRLLAQRDRAASKLVKAVLNQKT